MNSNHFPKGWDAARADALIAELEAMTDEEWVAWDDAASAESAEQTTVTVPYKLLPEIRKLLAGDVSTSV